MSHLEATVMPERVSLKALDSHLARYEKARGGLLNEDTESEAMFVLLAQYRGAYILSTGYTGPVWIGVQNATARWTKDGGPYPSVRSALECVLNDRHPTSIRQAVFYSEDVVGRLRWLADRIAEFKESGDFLLWR